MAQWLQRVARERIGLEKAKDQYRARMKPFQTWRTVLEEKEECIKYGVLEREDYDAWIERLEGNKDSIEESNPEGERILRKFDLLIEQLIEEQRTQFPEGGWETYVTMVHKRRTSCFVVRVRPHYDGTKGKAISGEQCLRRICQREDLIMLPRSLNP